MDNFYKFKKSCGVEDTAEGGINTSLSDHSSTSDQNRIIDLTRMCIVLSRIPLLRDTHSAIEEWNQRENEMNNEDVIEELGEEVDEEGEDDEEEDEEEMEQRRNNAKNRRGGVVFDENPVAAW